MFIDFQELKDKLSIEEVARILGLQLVEGEHQHRGQCPACNGSKRSLVITPDKQVFYCFDAKKGGDSLSLAAHILQVSVKEAAAYLVTCTGGTEPIKEPDSPEPIKEPPQALQPLSHLDFEHKSIGLPADTAEALGVGYAKRGMMRGRVVFPLYREGSLVGYAGYSPQDGSVKLPPNLTGENVVPLKKEA